jgi:hypothetical protein
MIPMKVPIAENASGLISQLPPNLLSAGLNAALGYRNFPVPPITDNKFGHHGLRWLKAESGNVVQHLMYNLC